ncbi:MAG: DUF1343 domain-containing protein, partial [Bacteroidales bacterium]
DLREYSPKYFLEKKAINLEWLLYAYKISPDKKNFFNNFFKNLAGNTVLRQQIEQGLDEDAIRKSWKPAVEDFKRTRKKYLLYSDFE